MTKSSEKYDYNSTFPTILRALMEERKVTQQKIAEICSVKPQSVSQWRNGETRPDILSLAKIAKYFCVSTDYLLGLTDIKSTEKATKELCNTLVLSETSVAFLRKEIPLYREEWETQNSVDSFEFAQTGAILNRLLGDHIDYLTNKDNRKTDGKFSLLKLLYSYLDHSSLTGSAMIYSNGESLDVGDITQSMTIAQSLDNALFADSLYSLKDLLIAQDIQKITAFLQDRCIDGIDREFRAEYCTKKGGDKK